MAEQIFLQLTVMHGGQQEVDIAHHLQADEVITHLNRRDLHELKVSRQLREHQHTRHAQIIALTAAAMVSQIQKADQAEANEYWTKPLEVAQSSQVLDSLHSSMLVGLNS